MQLFLRSTLAFLLLLVVTGGTILHTRIGKIEVASIDPFGLAFCIALFVTARFRPSAYACFVGYASNKLQILRDESKAAARLASFFLFVFSLIFLAHEAKYLNFNTSYIDMGYVNQALFSPFSEGKWLRSVLSPHRSYLADHFAPALLTLTPLTAMIQSNVLIFAIQATLLAGGTHLLVSQGPLKNQRSLWLVAAFVLVSERALRNGGVWDFREDVLAFFFLSASMVSLMNRKLFPYALTLAGFLLSKEHLGIVGFGILFPILFDSALPYSKNERRWIAGGSALLLLAWSAAVFWVITPQLQSGIASASNITARYRQFGNTPKEILVNLLTSPSAWWVLLKTKILAYRTLKYLILLLAPYAYFARFSWSWILAAAIGILINLTADCAPQLSLEFHYDLAWLPFLMMGVLQGISARISNEKSPNRFLLAGLLLALTFSGRWPGFHLTENLPSWKQVQDTRFLESLECSGPIAANMSVLNKVLQCLEVRNLILPEERCASTDPWNVFVSFNSSDSSQISGQSAQNAREFVLDRQSPCENTFAKLLQTRGYRIVQTSPSGRYLNLKAER